MGVDPNKNMGKPEKGTMIARFVVHRVKDNRVQAGFVKVQHDQDSDVGADRRIERGQRGGATTEKVKAVAKQRDYYSQLQDLRRPGSKKAQETPHEEQTALLVGTIKDGYGRHLLCHDTVGFG